MTQWGLDALFNPAKRHMDEEKRRLQATREQIGDSSGGKRIDLDSGKVRITRSGKQPATDGESAEHAEVSADADPGADADPDADAAADAADQHDADS